MQYVFTDLVSGYHLTDEFFNLNPNRQVPIIILKRQGQPDFVLYESHAILRFLASYFPCVNVHYPASIFSRARVDQWMDWKENHLRRSISSRISHFMQQTPILPTQNILMTRSIPLTLEQAIDAMERCFKLLDSHFESNPDYQYLVGNEMTIADISMICEISQLLVMAYDFAKYPWLTKWIRRMESLEHYNRTHQFLKRFGAKQLTLKSSL
jgi:glutathione S-transferase